MSNARQQYAKSRLKDNYDLRYDRRSTCVCNAAILQRRCQAVSLSLSLSLSLMWWLQLRFDGRSPAYQRSSRSQWRNPLAAVTLIYLFITNYLLIIIIYLLFITAHTQVDLRS